MEPFKHLDKTPAYEEVPDYHALVTVQLCELINGGWVDWKDESWDWSAYAVDQEQYDRVCNAFNERFYWREISIVPPGRWKQRLLYKLKHELMPKYKYLYQAVAGGINPLAEKDEFYKSRKVSSEYPETLLSNNADYASMGVDEEWEKVTLGDIASKMEQFERFRSVDMLLLDELETMFIGITSVSVGAL